MLTQNFARNAYLPARPMAVKRWGGISAIIGGSIGTIAYYNGTAMPLSSVVLLLSVLSCNLALFGLYAVLVERSESSGYPGRLAAVGAVGAVVSVISWLALGVFTALGSVWEWTAVPWYVTSAIGAGCWLAGLALLAVAAIRARLSGGLRVLPLVVIASVPISIFLPFFTTLGMPIVVSLPFIGTAFLGWGLLTSADEDRLTELSRAVSGIGIDSHTTAQAVSPRPNAEPPFQFTAPSVEAVQEKEVLEALRRNGELAVAGVALETSLSVEDADRMLSVLAARGHLDVRVVRGRLLYSL